MCQAGVSNKGRHSSTMIEQSNDCKWVFIEASVTPRCHAVVPFEVKMSRFSARFKRNTRTQLGLSSKS